MTTSRWELVKDVPVPTIFITVKDTTYQVETQGMFRGVDNNGVDDNGRCGMWTAVSLIVPSSTPPPSSQHALRNFTAIDTARDDF